MRCMSCTSDRQAEFTAEINMHFRGLPGLDKPSVLVFPPILVCLDCGFSRFKIPETELAKLGGRSLGIETSRREELRGKSHGEGPACS